MTKRFSSSAFIYCACVVMFALPATAATTPVMYVGDANSGAVTILRVDNGMTVGTIPYPLAPGGLAYGGSAGVATDSHDNVYVATPYATVKNVPGKIVIYGYAPGSQRPFIAIAGGCCGQAQVAVAPSGELAEGSDGVDGFKGDLSFYDPGRRRAKDTNHSLSTYFWSAYDAHGTLWVDGGGPGPYQLTRFGYFPHGSTTFHNFGLSPSALDGPLAIDAAENLLILNTGTIMAYDARGNQVYRVALNGNGIGSYAAIALSHDGTKLYVAEDLSRTNGQVEVYSLPAGGAPVATFAVAGQPFSIALGAI